MNARYGFVLLAALACAVIDTSAANAQFGLDGNCGYGIGYGGYDVGRLYGVLAQNVPHYAAFPPVYYSVPMPRTYGHSPFAYPPGFRTPEVPEAPQALEISNPYVAPASASADEKTDKVTRASDVESLLVVNPFVGQPLATAAGIAVLAVQ